MYTAVLRNCEDNIFSILFYYNGLTPDCYLVLEQRWKMMSTIERASPEYAYSIASKRYSGCTMNKYYIFTDNDNTINFTNDYKQHYLSKTSRQLIKTLHTDCAHFTAARTPLQQAIKSDLRSYRLLSVTSLTL